MNKSLHICVKTCFEGRFWTIDEGKIQRAWTTSYERLKDISYFRMRNYLPAISPATLTPSKGPHAGQSHLGLLVSDGYREL